MADQSECGLVLGLCRLAHTIIDELGSIFGPLADGNIDEQCLTVFQKVSLAVLARARDELHTVQLLVSAGHSEQAAGHARTLFELFLSMNYMESGDREQLARQYLDYDDVLRHRQLRLLRELASAGSTTAQRTLEQHASDWQGVEDGWRAYCCRYGQKAAKAPHWSHSNVRDLCRKLGLLDRYADLYMSYSEHIHVTPRALAGQFLMEGEHGTRVTLRPQSAPDYLPLVHGCGFALELAYRFCRAHGRSEAALGSLAECLHNLVCGSSRGMPS